MLRRYDFPSPWWDPFPSADKDPNGAKALISALLNKDAQKRLTAKEMLEHPWQVRDSAE